MQVKPRVRFSSNPIPAIDSEWPECGQGKSGIEMQFLTIDGNPYVKIPKKGIDSISIRDRGIPTGFYAGKIWRSSDNFLTWIYETAPSPCGKRMCSTKTVKILR